MGQPLLCAIGVLLGAACFCVGVVAVPPLSGVGMLILAGSILFPFVTGYSPTPVPAGPNASPTARQVNNNQRGNNNNQRGNNNRRRR